MNEQQQQDPKHPHNQPTQPTETMGARFYSGRLRKDYVSDDFPVLTVHLTGTSASQAEELRAKWGGAYPTIEDLVMDAAGIPDEEPDPWRALEGRVIHLTVWMPNAPA